MGGQLTLLSGNGPSDTSAKPAGGVRQPIRAENALCAAPFIAWVEQRIEHHNELEERWARERGITRLRPNGLQRVLFDIGWLSAGEIKRMRRWRDGEPGVGAYLDEGTGELMVPAEQIEAALAQANVALWELYPAERETESEESTPERFCPTCSEEVLVVDGECVWCSTPLGERPHTIARGGPSKRRRRPRGRTRRRRLKQTPIKVLPPPDPLAVLGPPNPAHVGRGMTEPFVREAMRVHLQTSMTILDTARVLFERHPGCWLTPRSLRDALRRGFEKRGVLVDGDRGIIRHRPDLLARERAQIETYLRSPDPGYAYRGPIPPHAVWEAAWRYYLDGYGFLRIARLLRARWPWLARSTERSLSGKLHYVFRVNGWPTRPQREATVAANYRHGMTMTGDTRAYERHWWRTRQGAQPHCDAVSNATGRPCGNFAMRGDTKCWAHSERTAKARNAALDAGRRGTQRELVDSRPFVIWLRGRVSNYGSQRAASEILEINRATLGRILSTGGTSHPGKVTRSVIERMLQATLRNDPDVLVPRFTDLYDTAPKADAQLLAPQDRGSRSPKNDRQPLPGAA